MAELVGAIQSAIEIVQRLRGLSKKIEDAEVKMLLADLSGDLADAKLEAANLKFEIAQLKEDLLIAQALGEAKVAMQPRLVDGAYQFEGEQGNYCTACYDSRRAKSQLSQLKPPFNTFGRWECPVCKAVLG
jgi:hypothetical protein